MATVFRFLCKMEIREDSPLFISVPALCRAAERDTAQRPPARRRRHRPGDDVERARGRHLRIVGVEGEGGHDGAPPAADTTGLLREALAVMLGLTPGELDRLSPASTVTAIARLHSLVERVQRLESQASIDDLTGMLRRDAGMRVLQREIDRARRCVHGRMAVVALDVDGLRSVNDALGRGAGDQVLVVVAESLRRRLPAYDPVIRLGGDEFLGVMYDAPESAAQRVAGELGEIALLASGGRTVSAGVATLQEGDDAHTLSARAVRATRGSATS